MIGRRLAHYVILERIGAGGMGVVYRARDTHLERLVALKVVGEREEVDENARARLLREARAASALNHPNICTIYEAGAAEGETYIAMEMVEGQTLDAMISGNGLPVETAIRYGAVIADALDHAHERGVVHRDLKSANVMVTPEGRPKVLDFGLAKRVIARAAEATRSEAPLTEAGTVAGTLAYMAPEVLRGEPADARSDLWALGVMLYHAVTGTLPFRGSTAFEISSAILRDAAAPMPVGPRGDAPPGLAAIVQRLLAKQPGERYQRASEVRAALEAIQSGAVPAAPARSVSRRSWLLAAVMVMVASAIAWFGINLQSEPPAPVSEQRLSDGNRRSTKQEANEYYERAMLFAGGGARHDPVQMRQMLERSLEIDARFAAARAQHAFTQMLMVLQGDSEDQSWLYKAQAQARQALKDDPQCSLAHSVLAGTYLLQGRKELVLEEVDKALKRNPNDPAVHAWLALYHYWSGDYEQAMQKAKQIIERWPVFWPARWNLGEILREQGDTAGAVREQQRILEQDPQGRMALLGLARASMDAGDLLTARQALERVRPEDRQNYRVRLALALLLALEKKNADALREMNAQVQAYAGALIWGPLMAAEFYAVIGDPDKALEWMDRAVRMGDDRESWLRRNPHLASIRNHPRFQQMLASVAYRRQQRPAAAANNR